MKIKTKNREIFLKAVNGLAFVAIAVLAIFGLVRSMNETPLAVADSPMMEGATPSGGMAYGSLTTHIYRINDGSSGAPCWNGGGCYTSYAMCLQPGKASHVGDYGYIGSSSNQAIIKIMLVTNAAVNPTIYNAFKSTGMDLESLGSQITSAGAVNYGYGGSFTAGQARAFVVGHVLAGAVYTGTAGSYYAGLSGSAASSMTQAYNTIMSWFNTNYSDAPPQYTLYTFNPSDSSHQTLGWIEGSYTPTPVVQKGYIQMLKYDSATGYNAALGGTGVLGGATFRVYNQSNSSVTLATRTTASNGYTPSFEAEAGQRICFVETSPPSGYTLDSTPHCAVIQANATTYVNMANTKATGNIRLYKYDSATNAPLANATFRVYEQGNSGVTLATKTTGSDGYTSTLSGDAGKVICFVETTPPTGYVQDTTPVCGTIPTGSTATVNKSNTKQVLNGGVTVKKVDVETNSTSARGSASVQGTTFTVYKSDSNGSVGTSTGVTLTTNAYGLASTSNSALSIDPVAGGSWYCVKETGASTGYNLTDTSCKKFYLTTNGQMFDLTSMPFSNSIIKGSLTITKYRKIYDGTTNSWTNAPFAGITFTLTNTANAGINYTTGETNADGVVTLNNIVYGTYTVVENESSKNAAYKKESFNVTISSQGQTISKTVVNELPDNPQIDTVARNTNSNPDDKENVSPEDKEIEIGENAGVTDYTMYGGLEAGASYRVEGELWKITPPQERITTKSQNFTASSGGTGSFDLNFNTIDTTEYIGETLGIIQKLYKRNGDEWLLTTVHNADFSDTKQIVRVVDLGLSTNASDDVDGDKIIEPTRAQVIRDEVTYQNLVVGRDYILVARLIDKAETKSTGTTKVLEINGVEVPAKITKITMPDAVESSSTVRFNIDATTIPGKEVVVYERVYEYVDGVTSSNWEDQLTDLVIGHENINDTNQTVKVRPRVGTEAVDKLDSDHTIGVGMATIVDTVSLEGLTKEKYKVVGYVVERKGENGSETEDTPIEAIVETGDRAQVIGETTIDLRSASEIPTETQVEFKFDTREFKGKSLVIYEELYRVENNNSETLIAWHKDANDAKQMIDVATPKIHTTATDKTDGDKELKKDIEATVIDKIEYEGLVVGDTYTLVGELRDKDTGEVIELLDEKTKVIHVFVAEDDHGFEEMEFSFKTDGMTGKEIVVFEELYFGEWIEEEIDEETGDVITPAQELTEDELIAEHKDLNDVKQTVGVEIKIPDTGAFTHGNDGVKVLMILTVPVAVAMIGFGTMMGIKVNRRRNFGWHKR